jgi:hypothetical protein
MSQTRSAEEIIVVDDGSTDDTLNVVASFPTVKYIRQDHNGKAVAFNRGFAASEGDLICHLDADDYWHPEKVKHVEETLARCDAGGILHEAVYVDAEDKYLYGSEATTEGSSAARRLSFQDVLLMGFVYRPPNTIAGKIGVANTICTWREAVADCFPLPSDLGLAVDGALLLSAARYGLLCLPEKLSAYRHHGNNSFVSSPGSLEFQSRLLKWAATIPGVLSGKDKRILEALELEAQVHFAVQNYKRPLKGAYQASLLVLKLLALGLVPNWKHFGLPVASLFGWHRRRSTSRPTAV